MINKKTLRIALPEEHGSWGFVLEPLILATIVGYSLNGLFLALASFLLFLSHQPIRIIFNKKKNPTLRKKAWGFLFVYLTLIVLFFSLVFQSADYYRLYPFFLALLLMGSFLLFELSGKARKLTSEIIATISISFIAVSIVLLSGWSEIQSWAFFFLLLNRAVPTVLFIHERVNFIHNKYVNKWIPILVGLFGFIITLFLAYSSLIPWFAITGVLVLIIRMIFGFTPKMLKQSLKTAGILEFVYGIIFVIITAIAYCY